MKYTFGTLGDQRVLIFDVQAAVKDHPDYKVCVERAIDDAKKMHTGIVFDFGRLEDSDCINVAMPLYHIRSGTGIPTFVILGPIAEAILKHQLINDLFGQMVVQPSDLENLQQVA